MCQLCLIYILLRINDFARFDSDQSDQRNVLNTKHRTLSRIFIVFGLRLLEARVLHKRALVATLLGTLLVQDYKKVKCPCTV